VGFLIRVTQLFHPPTVEDSEFSSIRDPQLTSRTIMSTSPTPSERGRADAEAKMKEEAEQAALPYNWVQTIKDVDITISIDGKFKGKDLDVKITKSTLRAAIKGGEVFIDVSALELAERRMLLTRPRTIG
jgi:HSP20 family molecular chaperone IbpA